MNRKTNRIWLQETILHVCKDFLRQRNIIFCYGENFFSQLKRIISCGLGIFFHDREIFWEQPKLIFSNSKKYFRSCRKTFSLSREIFCDHEKTFLSNKKNWKSIFATEKIMTRVWTTENYCKNIIFPDIFSWSQK